ncbi:hypothetical protein DPMN_080216 [Dreissena polymorpha]|uniref:Uncharacterized protein n=3 Tax=Dreissena polymorpha TaxID=45954 RepID=A0A9D4BRR7_DREPO|nr:hypothetical protein DPMN_080216 [Dreissena polymorpha]
MNAGAEIKVIILKDLQKKLQTFRRKTDELAASLEEVARVYNKAFLDVKKATIAGSAAGVVGGTMGVIGLVMAPFTAGASLLVSAAGAGVGALGGITAGGAAIGESVERKNAVKKAEEIVKKFEQERKDVIKDCKQITDLLGADNLDKDFPFWASFITKLIIGSSTIAWSVALRALNGIVSGIRLGKAISEFSLEAVMAGGGVATCALRAGSVAARGLHVVGAAVGIILIPIDLGFLVHSAHAVATDKVSDTSKKISQMAEKLRASCPSEGEIDDAVFKTIEKLINQ